MSPLPRLGSPMFRRDVALARATLRMPTAGLRPLPNCLIIGAQRSGTSSLYKYLGGHPNVSPGLRKEVRYFTDYYDRGPSWYRAHFSIPWQRHRRTGVAFDATPDYLLDPRVPDRVRDLLDSPRIVVLLRNPVDRAYSHFRHMRRLGFESLTFADAIRAEADRLAPAWACLDETPERVPPKAFYLFSYITRSRYALQLERWMLRYPAERILVMKSEDLFADPSREFGRILRFLDLPPWEPAEFKNYSYRGRPAPTSSLSDPERRFVLEAIGEDVRRLPLLVGQSFRWEG